MRHRLAPAAICIPLFVGTAAIADPAPSTGLSLAQALNSFDPTPKQTIALRDFLGRTDKVVPLGAQSDGLSYFDLRDSKNQRVGQIAVGHDDSEQSIFVARLSGPAVFDASRKAQLPKVQNGKMRAAISAALAGAEAGPVYETVTSAGRDLFLRIRPLMAVAPLPANGSDRIIESEASFFSDGSGIVRGFRAPVGTAAAMPIHVSAKFLPALEADGQKAFRENALGVDADFTATLADLGNKVPCATSTCPPPAPIAVRGEVHLTTWAHAVVPSAPANLIAQISPPPPPPPAPDILQDNGAVVPPDSSQPGSINATGQPDTN